MPMMSLHESTPEKQEESPSALLLRAAFHLVIAFGIWGGLLFLSAGSTAWPRAWFHLGLWLFTFTVNAAVLLRYSRDVLSARLHPKRTTERVDTILLRLFLPAMLAVPIIAGLDVRLAWSPLPFWNVYPALALHAMGDALLLWTMVVNPFLEKTVRVQTERGHRVITTGPYAVVRHPMYLAVTLMFLAIPPTLGSAWTLAPVAAMTLMLMLRTKPEEELLRRNLPGYEEYMTKTRWRILPGIW